MKSPMVRVLQIIAIALLGSLVVSNLVSCSHAQLWTVTPTPQAAPAKYLPTVLLLPEAVEREWLQLSRPLPESSNIVTVHTAQDLKNQVASVPETAIIYIHKDNVDEIEKEWLQEQYDKGRAIVGLNMLLSEVTDALGVAPRFEDLKMEYARDRIPVALVWEKVDPYGTGKQGSQHADFYGDLALILGTINHAYHHKLSK